MRKAASGKVTAGGSRRRASSKGLWVFWGALALAGALFLLWGQGRAERLWDPPLLWARLVWPLLRITFFLALGLLAGQFIESLGWTARLGVLARPLFRWARLPAQGAAAFSAAFVSGLTANALLLTAHREGRLNRRQLIFCNLLNASLPAYVLHAPSTILVALPLVGATGLWYFGLTLAACLLRMLGSAAVSRRLGPACPSGAPAEARPAASWRQAWRQTWPKFQRRLRRLLLVIVPVYLLVFLLARAGFFKWLGQAAAELLASQVLPIEAMSVVVFSLAAEFTSGFAAAGALLATGDLNQTQAVLTLILGTMVATPLRVLRHQLPYYMGLFPPGLATALIAIGQGARVLSLAMMALVFWLLIP